MNIILKWISLNCRAIQIKSVTKTVQSTMSKFTSKKVCQNLDRTKSTVQLHVQKTKKQKTDPLYRIAFIEDPDLCGPFEISILYIIIIL